MASNNTERSQAGPARSRICHWQVVVCCGLWLLLLTGCPQSPPANQPSATTDSADDGQVEADDAEAAGDGENDEADSSGENDVAAQPPTDGSAATPARDAGEPPSKKFIAELRELGASVELDDDGHILSRVLGFTKLDDDRLKSLGPLPRLTFLGIAHTNINEEGVTALTK